MPAYTTARQGGAAIGHASGADQDCCCCWGSVDLTLSGITDAGCCVRTQFSAGMYNRWRGSGFAQFNGAWQLNYQYRTGEVCVYAATLPGSVTIGKYLDVAGCGSLVQSYSRSPITAGVGVHRSTRLVQYIQVGFYIGIDTAWYADVFSTITTGASVDLALGATVANRVCGTADYGGRLLLADGGTAMVTL